MRKGNISVFLLAIVAVVGLVLSGIGLHEYAVNFISNQIGIDPKSSFCDINSELNCTAVNQSSWAVWLGVPVAAYGLWLYLSLIFAMILLSDKERFDEQEKSDVFSFVSVVGVLVSVFLFLVSKFQIGVFCPVCLGVYAVNILFAVVTIFQRSRRKSFLLSAKDGFFNALGYLFESVDPRGRARSASLRLFILACLLSGVLSFVANDFFALRYLNSLNSEPKWEDEPTKAISLDLNEDIKRDFWRGNKSAPITLVEFADYECPACQVIYFVIEELLNKYEGKILYVYKNYPLDTSCNKSIGSQMHENACRAAMYARCAGQQGKFWEMSDYLFRIGMDGQEISGAQYQEKLSVGTKELKLSQSQFDSCLADSVPMDKIISDIAEGDRLELTGTPSIFINGKLVRDVSFEGLEVVIESILAKG